MALQILWTQGGVETDVTSQADFNSLTIEQNASGINAICRLDIFTLLPYGDGQYTKRDFAIRDLVRIKDTALSGNDQWLFSGFITSITPKQEGDYVTQSLEIADYTSVFDVVILDDMTVGQRSATLTSVSPSHPTGSVTGATRQSPSAIYTTYNATSHGLVAGDYVTVSGVTGNTSYNIVNKKVVGVSTNTFWVELDPGAAAGTFTSATWIAHRVTYYCSNSFAVGDTVTVTHAESSEYDLTSAPIIIVTSTYFVVSKDVESTNITNAVQDSPTAGYITYTSANSLVAGDAVTISGINPTSFNLATATVDSANSTTFVIQSSAAKTTVTGAVWFISSGTQYITYTATNSFSAGDKVTLTATPSIYSVTAATITSRTATTFTVQKTLTTTTITNVVPNPGAGTVRYTTSGTNPFTTSNSVSVASVVPSVFNLTNQQVTAYSTSYFDVSLTEPTYTVTNAIADGLGSITYTANNTLSSPYGKITVTGINSGSGGSSLNVTGATVTSANSSSITVSSTFGYASITAVTVDYSLTTPSAGYVTYTATNSLSVGDRVNITGIVPSIFNATNAQVTARSGTQFAILKTVSSNAITAISAGSGSITYTAANHNIQSPGKVTISGIAAAASQYNLTGATVSGTTTNTFTVTSSVGQYTISAVAVTANSTTHTAVYTTSTNALTTSNLIGVTGVNTGTSGLLNFASKTPSAVTSTSFTITYATAAEWNAAGQWLLTAGTKTATDVTYTTSGNHNLQPGDWVDVVGVTGTGWSWTSKQIASPLPAANQFKVTYVPSGASGSFGTSSFVIPRYQNGGNAVINYNSANGGTALPVYSSGGTEIIQYVSGGSIADAYSSGGSAVAGFSSATSDAKLSYASGGSVIDVYDPASVADLKAQSGKGLLDVEVIDSIFAHVDGTTGQNISTMTGLEHQPTATDYDFVRSDSTYLFANPATGIVESFQGMTVHDALDSITKQTGYSYWIDEALRFYYGKTRVRDITLNGSASTSTANWSAAPAGTTLTRQTTDGPYSAGTYFRYQLTTASGVNTIKQAITPKETLPQSYMITFRYRTYSTDESKSGQSVIFHWYDASSNLLKTTTVPLVENQSTWTKTWMLSTYSGATAATNVDLTLSLGTSGESGSRTERIDITDIQIVPISTDFGFLETGKTVTGHGDADTFSWQTYENPETAIEGAQARNVVRVYGAWTDIATHDKYTEFVHPQGVWALRGRKVYGSLFDQTVVDDYGAAYRAAGYFEKEGVPLRTVKFDHEKSQLSIRAGDIVPFVWETGDIYEPFLVKENSAKWIGNRLFWSSTLGGDPTITRTNLYAVNNQLAGIERHLDNSIPPAAPTNLVVVAATPTMDSDGNNSSKITATWDANKEEGFRAYIVKFSTGDTASEAAAFGSPVEQTISRKTGTATRITTTAIAPTSKYVAVQVAATDYNSNTSDYTVATPILTPKDTTAPNAPTNISVTSTISAIAVAWDFDTTVSGNQDMAHFELQRVENSTSTFPGWTDTSSKTFIYETSDALQPCASSGETPSTDNVSYGTYYWYRTRAIDVAGNASAWLESSKAAQAGKANSADIGSVSANSLSAGTITLSGLSDPAITSTNFTLSSGGELTANNINIAQGSGNLGLLITKNKSQGDIGYSTSGSFSVGTWNKTTAGDTTGTFVERLNLDASGNLQVDGTITSGTTLVSLDGHTHSGSSLANGRITAVEYDPGTAGTGNLVGALQFYAGASGTIPGTYRARIRASDATSGRLVIENTEGSSNAQLFVSGDVYTDSGGSVGSGSVPSTALNDFGAGATLLFSGEAIVARDGGAGTLTLPDLPAALLSLTFADTTSAWYPIRFRRQKTSTDTTYTMAGGIQVSYAGVVSVLSASDYRLKDNIEDAKNYYKFEDVVKQIKIRQYEMKDDPGIKHLGFIAHELQQIIPEAATGTKDEIDSEGKPVYQNIVEGELTKYAIGAIQELSEKVRALQQDIAALKN